MVFMGVLVDTVNMVVRFEATQCQGFKLELESALAALLEGKPATKVFVHHLCGKFIWYSCVVQSGRLHTRSWFQYLVDLNSLSPRWLRRVVADTHWWLQLIDGWCNNRLAGIEYPIWSGADLLASGRTIVVQSDASGTDGVAYYTGGLDCIDPAFVARMWEPWEIYVSSMRSELIGLLDYMRNTNDRNYLLVWISDALAAVSAVNKGSCGAFEDLEIMTEIFRLADERGIYVVALWVPREENQFADFLSHLSSYTTGRPVHGYASAFQAPAADHWYDSDNE